jgi:zinc protease
MRPFIARTMRAAAGAVFASCVLLLLPASTYAQSVATPKYERVVLPNGAVLLLMERHDVPLIAFDARIRGGAALDPRDRFGTANLFAGLLEKGAGNRDALQFAQTVASVGGAISTGAGAESISISGSFLARDRKLMVELLADMLQRPKLDPDQLSALQARQIEFIRAAKDSNLDALTSIYGAAALYGAHPYGNPVVGSERTLAAITLDNIQRFYAEHVGADRLIVTVAGDFKTAEMKNLVSRAFSSWRKAGRALPSIAPPQKLTGRRVVLIDAPESVQSYLWFANIGVARNDPRRGPLDLANTLFGGRFTSMLNTELRIRSGLSYGAHSSFDRLQQPGHWSMESFTRTETTIEAIDLAFATLDKLHAGAIDDAALASSKKYVLGQFPLGFETAAQWAAQLSTLELYGLDARYIDGYAAAIESVALNDIQSAIGAAIPKSDNVVLVVIGKAAELREALAKYGPLTELALSDQTWSR